ncbi:hypothetical protein F4809DRAFT_372667 [Biscogniauxia mediterranea]|nr:hypothetical protein F4809DRAFT_372667 [Biscogniauxia mediterranea]
MGDFDAAFEDALKVQSWSLYSVGMLFIVLRLYGRARRLGGVTNFQIDDYLMMLASVLYTALIVCLNVIAQGGGSNLYPPELEGTFTPEEIQERVYGSKIVVVSEQAMLNCIYTIKVCMLIMYTRLTLGLTQQKAVRYLGVYVAMGWMASEVAFFTACMPFEGYWGMPPPNPQCTTLQYYAIVTGCFNISSDLLMLGIPIPLVLGMNMPWRRKVVLLLIFGLGLFVIIAALLTKIFNLTNIWDPGYMLWYVREASVAVYVSNLPMMWPLLRDWFPFLRALNPTNYLPASTDGQQHRRDRYGRRSGNQPLGSNTHGSHGNNKNSQGGKSLYLSRSRPTAHRHSLSSLDSAFPMELGITPASKEEFGGSMDRKYTPTPQSRRGTERERGAAKERNETAGSEDDSLGRVTSCDSQEHIVASLGLEHTIVMEHQAGAIQVERTIVVEERRARGETDAATFDWERQGIAAHTVDAEARR